MRINGNALRVESRDEPVRGLHGIVVTDARLTRFALKSTPEPRIFAFVWGGKVRPSPTLPFGRWDAGA